MQKGVNEDLDVLKLTTQVISFQLKGVKADDMKLKAMVEWPFPKNLKALRGFLGLTGYYRKFVKGYGTIATPLTNMLKKNAFSGNEESKRTF